MTKSELKLLLQDFKRGVVREDAVIEKLSALRFESLGFATVDHHRGLRKGFPEVILCQGKTPAQVAEISSRIAKHSQPLLATRATVDHFTAVRKKIRNAHFHELARVITANEPKKPEAHRGMILVVTAGTSDIPVAEEAAITATMLGNPVERLFDVGVAGIHRLF